MLVFNLVSVYGFICTQTHMRTLTHSHTHTTPTGPAFRVNDEFRVKESRLRSQLSAVSFEEELSAEWLVQTPDPPRALRIAVNQAPNSPPHFPPRAPLPPRPAILPLRAPQTRRKSFIHDTRHLKPEFLTESYSGG